MMAARHPALVLEDKGVNLALHFRAAPALRAEMQEMVRSLAGELGGEFEVQFGKMVVELRPSGKDKGVAIAEFLEETPFRGRAPVFVGDDLTDEDAFAEVRAHGFGVRVGGGRTKSLAVARLRDCEAVARFLARWLRVTAD